MWTYAFVLSVVFLSLGSLNLNSQTEDKTYADAHNMFFLRDVLSRERHPPDFFAAQVACAFNDTTACEDKLKKILATHADPARTKQIHQILAAVALREGRYRRTWQEINALLAIDPNDSDARGSRPLVEVLRYFPDQAVQGDNKATTQLDGGKLPILINGHKASYFFDTGANLSVLAESEAARFGMEVQNVAADQVSKDISGNKVSFRVALAKRVSLGGIELSNVAFLVSSDDQQPFVDLEPGHRGLIGLPILSAWGSVAWTRGGMFEADRSPTQANPSAANLFFDDLDLITQARFENHVLPFILDTGAANSELWPKFADAAHDLVRTQGTQESHTVMGMGGNQEFEVTSIPKVMLILGGMPVALEPARILKTQQRDAGKWFCGNLGIDLLGQAEQVIIDFRKMTLVLLRGSTDNKNR